MALKDTWDGLSPNAKRASVLAGAAAGILALAGASTVFSPIENEVQQDAQERLMRNLLTDADPRAMGIEGLSSRVEGLEDRMDEMLERLRAAQAQAAAPAPSAAGADPAQAAELEALRAQLAEMQRRFEAQPASPPPAPTAPQASPPPTPEPVRQAPAQPPAQPPARTTQPPTLNNLFGPPTGATSAGAPALVDAGRPPPRAAGGALSIRTVAATAGEAGAAQAGDVRKPKAGEVFIPAGTILSGVLLNGTDMPTGQQAREQPTPVLIRIKDLAILPNYVRTDVRECFLITSGFGDLASERAYLRGETFSCVRSDGGVIEIPLDGYAVGEDGKVGMRGRLVSKQGAMLAKALQAGFLQSFAQIFQATPAIPVSNATNGGDAQFQSFATPEAVGAGVASGVGGALNRLANFYLDMADQMFPVIEVDAGRGVEFILNRGAALNIRP